MRSLSTKLLAVTVPTLAALALMPGSASAVPSASQCQGRMQAVAAVSTTLVADANDDGLVCLKTNPSGKVIAKDDRP